MLRPPASIRAFAAVFGFFGALFMPMWVPIAAIIFLAIFWRAWEALLLGLFMALLWSPSHGIPFFPIGAILVVWICEPLRSEFLS